MIKLRGFQRGKRFELHQFCNDWISADDEDGKQHILNPTSVVLENTDELGQFLTDTNPGIFWDLYSFSINTMRFVKR